MRNILTLIFMALLTMTASCSSNQLNDAKLSLAKEAGHALEKGLDHSFKQELSGEFYAVNSCNVEAAEYGQKLREEIEELLKAKAGQKSYLVDSLCLLAVNRALPMVIESSDLAKPCLTKLGSVSAVKLGQSICEKINDD